MNRPHRNVIHKVIIAIFGAQALLGVASSAWAACPSSPEVCRTTFKQMLLVKNKTDNTKDKLIWKFIKGAGTTQAEFGNPITTATYNLCIYAGTTETLVADAQVNPSSDWQTVGTKGYKYKDKDGTQSGVTKILVKGNGDPGKTKALLKGKGIGLPDPLNLGPLGAPVTAQLLNSDSGVCWGTTFNAPKKDTNEFYKAKE